MTPFGPTEFVVFLLVPVLLILTGTSVAIIRKEDATVEWVLSAAFLTALATGVILLLAVGVTTLLVGRDGGTRATVRRLSPRAYSSLGEPSRVQGRSAYRLSCW